MTASLIDSWYRVFGSSNVTPRTVINAALDRETDLLAALSTIEPTFTEHPHPHVLSRWLHKNENYPFQSTAGATHRFTRDRQGWRLIPTPALDRAAQ